VEAEGREGFLVLISPLMLFPRRKNSLGSPGLKIARKRLGSNVSVSSWVSSQWEPKKKKISAFPAKAKLGVG